MTWPALVADHDGHWLRFDGPDALRCHTCDKDTGRRLLIPLRPDLAPTSTAPPWRRELPPDARPMPAGWRERVAAELAARKRPKEQT